MNTPSPLQPNDEPSASPSNHSMVAVMFDDRPAAERAVTELQAAGFSDNQLDILPGGNGRPDRVLVTVATGNRPEQAVAIVGRHGGETSGSRPAPAQPAAAVEEPRTSRHRIELMAEQLHVRKEKVKTGEVRIRKEIITEMRTIEVPVTREELVIEQRLFRPGGGDEDDPPFDEIRIPLMEEQIIIEKRPVIIEEIFIDKREVSDIRYISQDVQRETLYIDQDSNPSQT